MAKKLSVMEIDLSEPSFPRLLWWVVLFLLALWLSGMPFYFESIREVRGPALEHFSSYQLATYSNTLLAASTAIYVANMWFASATVGRWATGLAATGAVGVTLSLLTRWLELDGFAPEGYMPVSNLYEVISLFVVITVVAYLVMELVYRNRSAGPFVMLTVMTAVAFEIWLVSQGATSPNYAAPGLTNYWARAHILARIIGYGAFVFAAAMGVVYLLRYHAELQNRPSALALRALPDLWRVYYVISTAIMVGFPVFVLAAVLAAGWTYEALDGDWAWNAKDIWSMAVLVIYGSLFSLLCAKRMPGLRMAWWTILGLGATLVCFVGVYLAFSGLPGTGAMI